MCSSHIVPSSFSKGHIGFGKGYILRIVSFYSLVLTQILLFYIKMLRETLLSVQKILCHSQQHIGFAAQSPKVKASLNQFNRFNGERCHKPHLLFIGFALTPKRDTTHSLGRVCIMGSKQLSQLSTCASLDMACHFKNILLLDTLSL